MSETDVVRLFAAADVREGAYPTPGKHWNRPLVGLPVHEKGVGPLEPWMPDWVDGRMSLSDAVDRGRLHHEATKYDVDRVCAAAIQRILDAGETR